MDKHEQLRDILISNNCPEVGDAIIDDICRLFGYPATTDERASIFVLKPIKEVANAEEARDFATEWQQWAGEQSLSYGELAHYAEYFEKLAKQFNLTDEFKENAII